MTENSDKTYERGATLHSACACCEHAADKIEWRPLHVIVGLHIEQRDDGGIRILTSVPGAYLSGRDPAKVFADLGAVLQKCLIGNEHHLWCGAEPLDEHALIP